MSGLNDDMKQEVNHMIEEKLIGFKKNIIEEVDNQLLDDMEDRIMDEVKSVNHRIDQILENLMSKNELRLMLTDVEAIMAENAKQTVSIRALDAKLDGSLLAEVSATVLFFRTKPGRLLLSGLIYIGIVLTMFILAIVSPTANEIIVNNTTSLLVGNGIVAIGLTVLTSKLKGGDRR